MYLLDVQWITSNKTIRISVPCLVRLDKFSWCTESGRHQVMLTLEGLRLAQVINWQLTHAL